jgi:putative transposase
MHWLFGLLGIHRSNFRYWLAHPRRESLERKVLKIQVKAAHRSSGGSAGARSIVGIFKEQDRTITRYLVSKLMKEQGLVSCQIPVHRY